ncbi:hypothetical protein BN2476_250011 [Paraburkholderia piptadeniae]|uniref:Uncharacterized protein n=1 Tax=Paraburkholderia piptadeniae TaxID=1701573 RepID=A0A1N7RZX9_9BURK|nr:hypothetical protein BN2476_250011 [Paraburkholderia piptadeniae]
MSACCMSPPYPFRTALAGCMGPPVLLRRVGARGRRMTPAARRIPAEDVSCVKKECASGVRPSRT